MQPRPSLIPDQRGRRLTQLPTKHTTKQHHLHRGYSGLIGATLALIAFGVVLVFVERGDSAAFDLAVTQRWQQVTFPGLLPLMQLVSWFGFRPQSIVLGLGIIAGLLLSRQWLAGGVALLALVTGSLSGLIKDLVQRPRPALDQHEIIIRFPVGGYSFPSGHVLSYVIFLGFLAYLAMTLPKQRLLRYLLPSPLLGLIILIGPSRIYLGQHWATDTLGSYFLGTAFLLLIIALYRKAEAQQARTQST